MAPRKRSGYGQGFSLFDLKDDIASAVELLGDALSRQGVGIDKDNLFLQLQAVVKNLGDQQQFSGSPSPSYVGGYGGGNAGMIASDNVPYSLAGDLLVIAFEHFQGGDKREAAKHALKAMDNDDFGAIASGLLAMNRLHAKNMQADDGDEDEDETGNNEDEELDEDSSEGENSDDGALEDDSGESDEDSDDDDDGLTDDELTALVDDHENELAADDAVNDSENENDGKQADKKGSDVEEDEDSDKDEPSDSKVPMGATSSTITASHTSKVLANRLSSCGDPEGRKKAQAFLKKNPRM